MKARLLAYYLPQYHPIPENDEWWGKGFTEWTNVAKARPLFRGHWQPRLPADLGFYDLRVPEVREAQADLARSHGLEGFIYYHYWFGEGRRILERPFNEVLETGRPDFPFCLCWANATWSGVWYGETNRVLIEQKYGGREDYKKHFETLLPAFNDERYIRVDGKPLFHVYLPRDLPDSREFTDVFREMAHRSGLPGLYLVAAASSEKELKELGYDAAVATSFPDGLRYFFKGKQGIAARILNCRFLDRADGIRKVVQSHVPVVKYEELISFMELKEDYPYHFVPCAVPSWDNTPRSGPRGSIVLDSTPELFEAHLSNAIEYVQKYPEPHRLVFIKSWNEWAEGNYLEPDTKFGTGYLEATRNAVRAEFNDRQDSYGANSNG